MHTQEVGRFTRIIISFDFLFEKIRVQVCRQQCDHLNLLKVFLLFLNFFASKGSIFSVEMDLEYLSRYVEMVQTGTLE